jgi:hypothetical protein
VLPYITTQIRENVTDYFDLPEHPGCGDIDCHMDHDWWPGTTLEQANALIAEQQTASEFVHINSHLEDDDG